MKVMVLVKATATSEAGEMPGPELFEAMTTYNEALARAGIMLAGEGLRPTRDGVRIAFDGSRRDVRPGPFPDPNAQLAGFWLWQVRSMDEAIEWARRCPNPHPEPCELELRPLYEADDFGDSLTPEVRAREEQLRDQIAARDVP